MEGYDRAFILPDEREELAGFRECMALNFGHVHRELVAVFEDQDGNLLAGASFLALTTDTPEVAATIALNYIYVEHANRQRGMLRQALTAIKQLTNIALGLKPDQQTLIFIEQNDPLKMSPEEYRIDTEHSGLDQIDRLTIWSRMGAKVVDFPYVQPALSLDQQPEDGLIYAVLEPSDTVMDPKLLHHHLSNYFSSSVLKGGALPVETAEQLDALALSTSSIALLDMEVPLNTLRLGQSTHKDFRSLAAFFS